MNGRSSSFFFWRANTRVSEELELYGTGAVYNSGYILAIDGDRRMMY